MDAVVEFFVDGKPAQQGSKSPVMRGGRPSMFDQNAKRLHPWRAAVTAAALEAWGDRAPIEGGVVLECVFQFERGKTVRRPLPTVYPDLSKLIRAVEDSITVAQVWKDDALVLGYGNTTKVYAERAGVQVRIGLFEPAHMEGSK